MATRTIARMFDDHASARAAVTDLEAAGFLHDDISIVARDATATETTTTTDTDAAATGAGTGATIGTVVGGGAGLLAGLGALAIPGIGPIVAAGWLVATLTAAGAGAAAGGLLGSLAGAGVEERDAHVYAEGVRRGGSLVTVRTDDLRAAEAETILARHNPVDVEARDAEWRSTGWTGYDETRTGYDEGLVATTPDGSPGNPPGTMASRGLDQVAGTNVSGAFPQQSEGTPANPPGTAASRTLDDVAGTNTSGARPENEKPPIRRTL